MNTEAKRQIRSLLSGWRGRGWVDVDDAALRVTEVLQAGGSPRDAAKAVPATFLKKNDIKRSDVESLVMSVAPQRSTRRAVVFTALPMEYKAVLSRLGATTLRRTTPGTRFEVGTIVAQDLDWEVAVAQIGPGNLGAAAETAQAIVEFDPDLVLFVGVAGALKKDLEIGTVVIASKVDHYEGGKSEAGGWKARPLTFRTSHRIEQLAIAVARDSSHPAEIKPIAAGEALVKAARSEVGRLLDAHYNDAVAVDMESAGMYDAAHRAERAALSIRGISDHLDDKDPERDKRYQPLASERASTFAIRLLQAGSTADFPRR